jgi:hypothetical protein
MSAALFQKSGSAHDGSTSYRAMTTHKLALLTAWTTTGTRSEPVSIYSIAITRLNTVPPMTLSPWTIPNRSEDIHNAAVRFHFAAQR